LLEVQQKCKNSEENMKDIQKSLLFKLDTQTRINDSLDYKLIEQEQQHRLLLEQKEQFFLAQRLEQVKERE